jgi:hypothetical protein
MFKRPALLYCKNLLPGACQQVIDEGGDVADGDLAVAIDISLGMDMLVNSLQP